jgi:hypothetical protein
MCVRGHRRQQKLKEKGDTLTLRKMSVLLHMNAVACPSAYKCRQYLQLALLTWAATLPMTD